MMRFEQAMEELRGGSRVQRKLWVSGRAIGDFFWQLELAPGQLQFLEVALDGEVKIRREWKSAQDDLIAEDWELVEPPPTPMAAITLAHNTLMTICSQIAAGNPKGASIVAQAAIKKLEKTIKAFGHE